MMIFIPPLFSAKPNGLEDKRSSFAKCSLPEFSRRPNIQIYIAVGLFHRYLDQTLSDKFNERIKDP
jgi:hypothetical protein